ncbi:unnamed protein product [Acidocella sp. C78]|uniref:hypothetical protein n=1 Tax=Acidocella sp. C78 TaxID=1671486 RepID=UPI00191BA3B1|nr:hypothetical protein [Acidocella sp. C78]CAG4909637.1 unnamed protein product [Acidocella sp. C78]
MTGADAERQQLLRRRLALVGAISALNAEALRTLQQLAGLEIDMQRLEDDARMQDSGSLSAANGEAAALREAQADCAARIEAVEAEMAEIDRHLAALAGN